jgi:hypothetical protein
MNVSALALIGVMSFLAAPIDTTLAHVHRSRPSALHLVGFGHCAKGPCQLHADFGEFRFRAHSRPGLACAAPTYECRSCRS